MEHKPFSPLKETVLKAYDLKSSFLLLPAVCHSMWVSFLAPASLLVESLPTSPRTAEMALVCSPVPALGTEPITKWVLEKIFQN